MAVVAPFVIFGFLYGLVVEPQRAAASAAQRQLAEVRATIGRERSVVRPSTGVSQTSPEGVGDFAESLRALLNSPTVGRVANVSIETGAAAQGSSPVTTSFDARYDEIGRFFWNLRTLPPIFEIRSVELAPGHGPLVHASVALLVVHRTKSVSPQVDPSLPMQAALTPAPEWKRNPFEATSQLRLAASARREPVLPARPDPVVNSILLSVGRRVALIDGRIVKEGDRVGSAVVRSIEPDSVVIATPDGEERRLLLKPPVGRR